MKRRGRGNAVWAYSRGCLVGLFGYLTDNKVDMEIFSVEYFSVLDANKR